MAPFSEAAAEDKFCILPIQMPSMPSFPHAALHEVRIRRNAPKIPTAHDSRSLFLKNVPVDSTEAHFRSVFAHLVGVGRFETILFEDEGKRLSSSAALGLDPAQAAKTSAFAKKRKWADRNADEDDSTTQQRLLLAGLSPSPLWSRRLQRSGTSAVVVLVDEKSVQQVLKAIGKVAKTKKYPVWGQDVDQSSTSSSSTTAAAPLGGPWISAHLRACRPDKASTQAAVHAFFNAFNRKEQQAIELAKRLRSEPDEDGFVTVTRGGRAAPASRGEAEEAKRKMVEKQERKKAETRDFYRFQLRERRKAEQAALLRRFDEDRQKVHAMREKRGKFQPEK